MISNIKVKNLNFTRLLKSQEERTGGLLRLEIFLIMIYFSSLVVKKHHVKQKKDQSRQGLH